MTLLRQRGESARRADRGRMHKIKRRVAHVLAMLQDAGLSCTESFSDVRSVARNYKES